MPPRRKYDVTLFGASGFVGKLTAAYLAEHAPAEVRIALAGRSRERLKSVRDGLGAGAKSWPIVVADSAEPESIDALAKSTWVVVTTVGPYRSRGLPLVAACAQAGTDYADLTGEVLFMHDSAAQYHAAAEHSGARIVHSCGFDSIPSDLGVLLLHEAATADRAGDLEDTTLVVTGLKGGLSGGTIQSMRGLMEELQEHPELRSVLVDPYALSSDREREPDLGEQRELAGVQRDDELGMWVGPFIMARTNTRVVRRSNALLDWAYGRRFRYSEVMGFGTGATAPIKAGAMSAGLAMFSTAMSFRPSREAVGHVLPKPGEGPDEELRRTGFFRIDIHTRTSSGRRYVAHIAAKGDPGYAATSVMLGESALCLALDRNRLPARAGVLTPATAMGDVLVERLRAAGQTYKVSRRRRKAAKA
ncbi:MAG: saccharopine dehydrogenase NADP-binding domain-containing protein [Candidatus Dormibacteraeota bacterium]|nr:saccharopine dehydrogenase NADP-binding domain-containing protein [Candidatus Dormibacteraeota bacterium]MBV9524622.1 saccharopine dehydrogenase NADP-binding domain-containing protein [Candidatus Dormibacteraeota bacterium]